LGAAGVWLGVKFLLPWLLPFVIAFALAAALEPLVRRLCRRRFPRPLAAGLCTAALLLLGGGGAAALLSRAVSELSGLTGRLPAVLSDAAALLSRAEQAAAGYIAGVPGEAGRYLAGAAESIKGQLSALPQRLSGKALEAMSALAAKSPAILLFSVTAGIGVYFFSASYPAIVAFLRRQIPPAAERKAAAALGDLKATVGRWFRAQALMMLMTGGELWFALALLRVQGALLLALVIALIDALPVLGTGTVLLPWALLAFLDGNSPLALGLVLTYLLVTLLRSCVQAKLLGDQLGLPPVVTLIAIYVGYRVMGVWGMVLFPIAAITLKQLNDRGFIRLWKKAPEIPEP